MRGHNRKRPASRLDIRYDFIPGDIFNVTDTARRSEARSVNCIMTEACWLIGRRIVGSEQSEKHAAHGKELLGRLSIDLGKRYGHGFSRQTR